MAYVPVKVYRNNEIRRFLLEGGENKRFSFQNLLNQIQQVYPGLDTSRVQVAWKDTDGDQVVMSTDMELVDAIRSLPADNQMLRLHLVETGAPQPVAPVAPQQQPQVEKPTEVPQQATEQAAEQPDSQEQEPVDVDPTRHRHVFCDGCHGSIWGIRYKCLTCPDYDLCQECIQKALHDEHPMIRIASPRDKSWKPAFFAAQGAFPMGPPGPFLMGPPGFFHGGHRGFHHGGPRGHGGHHHHHRGRGRPEWGRCPGRFQEETRPEQPAGQEPQQQANQHMGFNSQDLARDLNETLSSVLSAFGIAVATPPEATATPKPAETTTASNTATATFANGGSASASASATVPAPAVTVVHPDPKIAAALNYMLAMGYKNDGGWLTKLLEEKRGDVSAVLDILHPTQGH